VRSTRAEDDVFFNLGQNLRVSDCNGDGFDDLIVLSPLSQQGGDKRGHLGIFYNLMSKVDKQSGVLYLEDADFSMTGTDNYQWFGYDALCTPDQTLIVSSPGKRTPIGQQAAGAVNGYSLKDKSLKFTLASTEDQSKFGLSISYNKNRNLLAVGAPSRNYGMMYHAGAVYIYNLASSNLTFSNPKTVFYATDRAVRFGKHVLWVSEEDLVASAPSYTTSGTLSVPNDQGMVYYFGGASNLEGQYSSFWAWESYYTEEAGCRHGDTLRYSEKT